MSTANKHFRIKLIALTLIVTIFASLLPPQLAARIYAEAAADSTNFFNSNSSYPESPGIESIEGEPERSDRSGLFDEYEQTALEKLGKPATVEDVDPYKRSDVTYEIRDIANAFTRNYALESGNYTRLIFGRPVNYKTNEGHWRKINLSLQKEEDFYQTKDTPYSLKFSVRGTNNHVTSFNAANEIIKSGKLIPSSIEHSVCVLDFQPTIDQANELGAYACETVIRFQTNCSTFISDVTVPIQGALRNIIDGIVEIFDVMEVGFR